MVTRTILPARKRLLSSVRQLQNKSVSVGYFNDQGTHPDSHMSYPALMFLQEVYGVKSKNGLVHRRLFEMTLSAQRTDIRQKIRQSVSRNLATSPEQILHDFGEDLQKRLKASFGDTSLIPSNAPSTIKSKGSGLPLIDSGSLRDKLTYRVKNKS